MRPVGGSARRRLTAERSIPGVVPSRRATWAAVRSRSGAGLLVGRKGTAAAAVRSVLHVAAAFRAPQRAFGVAVDAAGPRGLVVRVTAGVACPEPGGVTRRRGGAWPPTGRRC